MSARLLHALEHVHIARLTIVQSNPVEVGTSPLQRLGNRLSQNENKTRSHGLVFSVLANSLGSRLQSEVQADEMSASP